jgi:hypothetical protein
MVAILNFVSPSEAFSDFIIEELTGELVTGRRITVVDRHNLALIAGEMNLQLSGDVSDESAQTIGRMLGAQSIVSGTLTNMGTYFRFRIRVISVETAAIQMQVSLNLRNDTRVAFLLGESTTSVPAAAQQESTRQPTQRPPQEANNSDDAWKNKWIYLGGGLGYGTSMWPNNFEDWVTPFFTIDFVLTDFFAIGATVGIGIGLYGSAVSPVVPVIPIFAKLGGKIGRIELTGNVGYTVGFGFNLGATFGFNIGPGILFAEFLGIPWASPLEGQLLDSAYFLFAGYKVGVGRDRR